MASTHTLEAGERLLSCKNSSRVIMSCSESACDRLSVVDRREVVSSLEPLTRRERPGIVNVNVTAVVIKIRDDLNVFHIAGN